MNIFYTHYDPHTCASQHCRVHRNKMIVEYAQLLSTAHRVLDGEEKRIVKIGKGTSIRKWLSHESDVYDTSITVGRCLHPIESTTLYAATHVNHPSSIWVRKSVQNYDWLYAVLYWLTKMYADDTNKNHKTANQKLMRILSDAPANIPHDVRFNEPPVTAPDKFKMIAILKGSSTFGYQSYLVDKLSEWQSRDRAMKVEFAEGIPEWYTGKAIDVNTL